MSYNNPVWDIDGKYLKDLDTIINGEKWRFKFESESSNTLPHFGVNSKDKVIIVFNTQDYKYCKDYLEKVKKNYSTSSFYPDNQF